MVDRMRRRRLHHHATDRIAQRLTCSIGVRVTFVPVAMVRVIVPGSSVGATRIRATSGAVYEAAFVVLVVEICHRSPRDRLSSNAPDLGQCDREAADDCCGRDSRLSLLP